jgi:hypothetical protein
MHPDHWVDRHLRVSPVQGADLGVARVGVAELAAGEEGVLGAE